MVKETNQVRLPQLIYYGLGDLYGGGSFLIIGMLFMFYLTEIAGLTPVLAGFVFAVGKVWDAISDPLMGYISDRTRSRFGRRRIFFLIGIVPIAVTFVFMWIPVGFESGWALFAYYSLSYVLFSTVFTMVMVPYAALNAEMSHDYKVRTRLSGARLIFSGIASLLGGTIPRVIIDQYAANPAMGYLVMSFLFAALFSLPWIIVFLGTWEIPYESSYQERKQVLAIFSHFTTIFRNRSFRIHIAMYIFSYTAIDILMALFAYYITYYIGKPRIYPIAMGSLLIVQIAAFPLYVFISNRRGKGISFIIGLSIWLFGMLLTFFLSPTTPVWIVAIVCGIIGLGTSAGVMIPWAILPSIIDVDEIITTQKRSGVYSGAMTLVRKFVQGIVAMPLIGFVLQTVGFQSNQEQTMEVMFRLKLFLFLGPAILIILGILVATAFKVTPQAHAVLTKEIERLKNGGHKRDVDPKTRETCEIITGIDYNKLYTRL